LFAHILYIISVLCFRPLIKRNNFIIFNLEKRGQNPNLCVTLYVLLKAHKYRLYPTKEQEVLLIKTFGCTRFVYNRGLALKTALYRDSKESISIFSLIKQIVEWKKRDESKWLVDVNSQALQASLVNLDRAYTNFFKKRSSFPRFKSKFNNNQSFCNPQNTSVAWEENKVYIPKFKCGIKAVLHRKFDGKIKSSTVSRTPSGKYFISVLVETDAENPKCKKPRENKTLGIDLGIKDFATFSDGTVIQNSRHLNKKLKQLKRQQRALSRKKKGSKNRDKQRVKVAKIHEKVSNSRKDFLHKVTHNIVENQNYTSIAIEDLNVAEMLKKGKKNKLSRHISDAGWGTFRTFLTYKCEKKGKNLLVIGRFEPSSRLCDCGHLNSNLTLKDREWDCPSCKIHHKRDELAAKNIKKFAFCKQNTSKEISVGQELPELSRKTKKLLEFSVRKTLKKECLPFFRQMSSHEIKNVLTC
jgi:putative transposase